MQKKTIGRNSEIFKIFLALVFINCFMACKKDEATPVVTIKAETIKDFAHE